MIGKGINAAMDVSSFLLDKLDLHQLSLIAKRPATVTYHDPCHLMYGLGVKKQPRELLKTIGINVLEKNRKGAAALAGFLACRTGIFQTGCCKSRLKAIQRQAPEQL